MLLLYFRCLSQSPLTLCSWIGRRNARLLVPKEDCVSILLRVAGLEEADKMMGIAITLISYQWFQASEFTFRFHVFFFQISFSKKMQESGTRDRYGIQIKIVSKRWIALILMLVRPMCRC